MKIHQIDLAAKGLRQVGRQPEPVEAGIRGDRDIDVGVGPRTPRDLGSEQQRHPNVGSARKNRP